VSTNIPGIHDFIYSCGVWHVFAVFTDIANAWSSKGGCQLSDQT